MRLSWGGGGERGSGETVEIFGFDVAFVWEGGGGDGLVVSWWGLTSGGEGAVGTFAEVDGVGVEECCEVELLPSCEYKEYGLR